MCIDYFSVSVASAGASEKSKTKRHTQSILSRFLPDSPYQPVISPMFVFNMLVLSILCAIIALYLIDHQQNTMDYL
jgi:hypothetical protein